MFNFSLVLPNTTLTPLTTPCTSYSSTHFLYTAANNTLSVIHPTTHTIAFRITSSHPILSFTVNPLRLPHQLQSTNKIIILYQAKKSKKQVEYSLSIFSQESGVCLLTTHIQQECIIKVIHCPLECRFILLLTPTLILIYDTLLQRILNKCIPPFHMYGSFNQAYINAQMELILTQDHGRVTKISTPFLFIQIPFVKLLQNTQELKSSNHEIPLFFKQSQHQTISTPNIKCIKQITIEQNSRLFPPQVQQIVHAHLNALQSITQSKLHFTMGHGLWGFYGTSSGRIIGMPLLTKMMLIMDFYPQCTIQFMHFGSRLLLVSLSNGRLIAYCIEGLPFLIQKHQRQSNTHSTTNTTMNIMDLSTLKQFDVQLSAPVQRALLVYEKMHVNSSINATFYTLTNAQVVMVDYDKCNDEKERISMFRGVKEPTLSVLLIYDYVALVGRKGMHLYNEYGYERYVEFIDKNQLDENEENEDKSAINSIIANAHDIFQKACQKIMLFQGSSLSYKCTFEGQILDNIELLTDQSLVRSMQSADQDFIQIVYTKQGNLINFKMDQILQSLSANTAPIPQIIRKNILFFTLLKNDFHLRELINKFTNNMCLEMTVLTSIMRHTLPQHIRVQYRQLDWLHTYTHLIALTILNALLQKHPQILPYKQSLLDQYNTRQHASQNTIFHLSILSSHPNPLIAQSAYQLQLLLPKTHAPQIHSLFLTSTLCPSPPPTMSELAWMIYFNGGSNESDMYVGTIISRFITIMTTIKNPLPIPFATSLLRLFHHLSPHWPSHFTSHAPCLKSILRLFYECTTAHHPHFFTTLINNFSLFILMYAQPTLKILTEESKDMTVGLMYPTAVITLTKELIVRYHEKYPQKVLIELIYVIISCAVTCNVELRGHSKGTVDKCLKEISEKMKNVCYRKRMVGVALQHTLFVYCLKSGKNIVQANFEKFGVNKGKSIVQISPKGRFIATLIGRHLHILRIEKIGCGRCLSFECQSSDCSLKWSESEESITVINTNSVHHLLYRV